VWRLASSPPTRCTTGIDQSAGTPQHPARPGGEFFTEPGPGAQRRYEALRAYLVDGQSAGQVAARFGYTPASLLSAVRDFRAGSREFFLAAKPGPRTAPGKDAARGRIVELRAAGHSIDEIAAALAVEGTR
jgi:transposase-like protein